MRPKGGWRLFHRQRVLCEARRCHEDEEIDNKHGRQTAHAGDWIVDEDGDEPRPVADDVFRRTYQAIDGED